MGRDTLINLFLKKEHKYSIFICAFPSQIPRYPKLCDNFVPQSLNFNGFTNVYLEIDISNLF